MAEKLQLSFRLFFRSFLLFPFYFVLLYLFVIFIPVFFLFLAMAGFRWIVRLPMELAGWRNLLLPLVSADDALSRCVSFTFLIFVVFCFVTLPLLCVCLLYFFEEGFFFEKREIFLFHSFCQRPDMCVFVQIFCFSGILCNWSFSSVIDNGN